MGPPSHLEEHGRHQACLEPSDALQPPNLAQGCVRRPVHSKGEAHDKRLCCELLRAAPSVVSAPRTHRLQTLSTACLPPTSARLPVAWLQGGGGRRGWERLPCSETHTGTRRLGGIQLRAGCVLTTIQQRHRTRQLQPRLGNLHGVCENDGQARCGAAREEGAD